MSPADIWVAPLPGSWVPLLSGRSRVLSLPQGEEVAGEGLRLQRAFSQPSFTCATSEQDDLVQCQSLLNSAAAAAVQARVRFQASSVLNTAEEMISAEYTGSQSSPISPMPHPLSAQCFARVASSLQFSLGLQAGCPEGVQIVQGTRCPLDNAI